MNMGEPAGFNFEDLIKAIQLEEGGEMQEPKVEQLMGKLRRLQQDKRVQEAEIKELISVRDTVKGELATLHTEANQLEATHKEKEELCRVLQLQCEESKQASVREVMQNKKSEELLEQYQCEIQEFKLKHRKQRMKFENQLHQLIELHKNLHAFTPERLPDEIEGAENTKSQLLSAEQIKMAQLHRLDEELEEMERQKQPATTAAETQEE